MPALPPIVFEDDALLAFDKPSGLLIAPDRWDKEKANLMEAVHRQLSPTIFNAHRLDRDTSGVVLCAKTKEALDDLCLQFERNEVEKEYVALVRGRPPLSEGEVDRPLAKDPERLGRMKLVRSGKAALTFYSTKELYRGWSLVQLRPHTGRTHQLRVHMQALGCPIVGDPWYGDGQPLLLSEFKRGYKAGRQPERPLLARLALHAQRVTLRHPLTRQPLVVEAPLPREFDLAIKQLRRWAS